MLARSLCIAFIFVFITFMSIGGFPSFIEDMKVFQRERLNGHYGVAAFIISNTLSAMPFLMMISFFSTTICHSVLGSQQGYTYYLYFFVGFYVNILVVESLMMAIASVVPNFLMGVIVGAGIQAIFILICGFFQLPNDIPKVFGRYPITHISFYYWSFQGQSKNHFQGLVINNESLFFREFRKISVWLPYIALFSSS